MRVAREEHMRAFLAVVALPALILSVALGPRGEVMAAGPMLLATPNKGHSGDLIDLSGTGLPPDRQLYVLMACPNWHALSDDQNVVLLGKGPVTNDRGEFAGYLMHAIELHRVASSPCQIYTSDGDNPYGMELPAEYKIVAAGATVPPCDRRMCLGVHPAPRVTRAGLTEQIEVEAWPGAHAQVQLSFPGAAKPVQLKKTLNWLGKATFLEPIPSRGVMPGSVAVRVRAWIGPMAREQKGQFIIAR